MSENKKNGLTSKTYILLLVGLGFFMLYLYFFVDVSEMLAVIQSANLLYYFIAAVMTILSVILYSLAWQFFIGMLGMEMPFRKTLSYTWAGIFVDLIVPAESVSGDITKIYLMTKDTEEDTGKIAASVMSSRIISMVVTLGGLIFGAVFLVVSFTLPQMVLTLVSIVIIYSAASIVLLTYLCFREETTWRLVNWVIDLGERILRHRWPFSNLRTEIKKIFEAFHEGIELLVQNPKHLSLPSIFSVLAWYLDVLAVMLIFYSIGFRISFLEVIVVYSLTLSIQAIPLGVPAEIGLTEIIMTALFGAMGVPLGVSAAATILTRILTVWLRIIIGYVAVQWVGIKVLSKNH